MNFVSALLLTLAAGTTPSLQGSITSIDSRAISRHPEAVDPALEHWILTLADRIADSNPTIGASAQQALLEIGRPALPCLQRLTGSKFVAEANAAQRLIARIEVAAPPPDQAHDRRGPPMRPDRIARALEGIDLSSDQRAQLEAIRRRHHERMQAHVQADRTADRDPQTMGAERDRLDAPLLAEMRHLLGAATFPRFERSFRAIPPDPNAAHGARLGPPHASPGARGPRPPRFAPDGPGQRDGARPPLDARPPHGAPPPAGVPPPHRARPSHDLQRDPQHTD